MPHRSRLLIVEDEEPIRVGLTDLFVYHGYDVETAEDGPSGLTKALSGTFDLILLDLMLPGLDGCAICDRVRAVDRGQPIIMLTARTADADIIQGLRLGADDYIAKPFSVTELVLRVRAVLRRSGGPDADVARLRLGDLELDSRSLTGRRGTEEIPFTRREVAILDYLATHGERPVSREELLNKVWGYARDCGLETRTVDIHIAKLRRKIEADPAAPRLLVTVRGVGYRLLAGET
ncbi:response regulator transcription factor [uncultured Thiocystis sp.]|uniref:response regulator transcription factor n=1 Tax=uncultured Thiocystis sp. TaxID=1202134 RepID=UPI0025EEE1DE|nr:response regulator transcription factor [uncultured Thiocystis sp.]